MRLLTGGGTRSRAEAGDEVLRVQRAAAGNQAAFENLFREHQDGLRRFLASRVKPPFLDDLLQEVWLAAWTSLPRYDERCRFKTWLFAVAVNKYRDHCRRRARAVTEVSLSEVEGWAGTGDLSGRLEATEAVRAMLQTLSAAQREVLDLYYGSGLTLAEVGRALGRNLNTVKYQFYRAHAVLAQALKEEENGQGM